MKRFPRFFPQLNIRSRIVFGILATGGVALALFAAIGITQTVQVTTSLSDRLETSVSLLAEEQLINTVNEQAEQTNQSFLDVSEEVENLANAWESLQAEKRSIGQGGYWKAEQSLIQLETGQYGNSADDISSVFIPAKYQLENGILTDVNTSAYLDFYAPAILEAHPSLLAVYAIDPRGITRYYPNINLAAVLPPDFDATQRPYYQITSPLFNPQHRTRWTIP